MNEKIELSIIVPVYNSEKSLPLLYQRLHQTLNKIGKSFECIFVDDGSTDSSWKSLNEILLKDKKVRLIQLTRNFGQHNALMCGFKEAKGKYIVTLDDDLQNPPEEIAKLYQKITEGFDVVYGQYLKKNHSLFRNLGSNLVQFVYRSVFGVHGNLTSFRIIRKEIVSEILRYQ